MWHRPSPLRRFSTCPLGDPTQENHLWLSTVGGQAGDTEFSLALHLSQVRPPPTRLEGMKRKNIQTHKHPYLAPFLFCSKTSGHLSGSSLFFFPIFKYLFIWLHWDLVAAHDLLSSCGARAFLAVALELSCPETHGILVP